ncbi:MAG: hypothetical protein Kow0059_18330 [Candidatus Sumerlaeia bacterium]
MVQILVPVKIRAVALIAVVLAAAAGRAAGRADGSEAVKMNFDPALAGGRPSLTLAPQAGSEPFRGRIIVQAFVVEGDAWVEEERETPTHTETITGREPYRLILPLGPAGSAPGVPHEPDRETPAAAANSNPVVVGVRVCFQAEGESAPSEAACWRAMYFGRGTALEYKGSPRLSAPADFTDYWAAAKARLARTPMAPRLEPVPERDTPTGRLFKVTLNSYDDVPIVCWYFVPRQAAARLSETCDTSSGDRLTSSAAPSPAVAKYPAVMSMPGWGAEEPPQDHTAEGYITLSVNPRGHGPSAAFFKTPGDHHLWNIESPEDYYYRAAYMDGCRALDFLTSRPEVDAARIGIWGGSQGGAFALAMGGLDGRVACVAANVPYLVNLPDFSRLSTLGSGAVYARLARRADIGERVRRTLGFVDPANIVPLIRVPVLVCVGLQDPVCPPLNGIVAINRLPQGVERRLFIDPDAGHENSPAMMEQVWGWMAAHLQPRFNAQAGSRSSAH